MSKSKPEPDKTDFADQMEALAAEAGQHEPSGANKTSPLALLQTLRPLVLGIEALSRTMVENTQKVEQLHDVVAAQASLPELISGLQSQVQQKGQLNQKLFDALHEELRGYKDNFLLEILQKPIIRDLLNLYDDLSEMHRRLDLFAKHNKLADRPVNEFLRLLGMSLDHSVSSLVEILSRMDVVRKEESAGKLDKQQHRAVAVVEAANPEENGDIIQSLKPSFFWRDRMFRPEEVVIKKWSAKPAEEPGNR